MTHSDVTARIHRAVGEELAPLPHAVLAASGGLDSMVLLHAAAQTTPSRKLTVATFDHASGDFARDAVGFVRKAADRFDIRFETQRAVRVASNESEWRDRRWRFLKDVATACSGRVATAHSESDQLETVVMRALRDTGARGLAALYAESPVVRPLLAFTRTEVRRYAEQAGIEWMEDPTNASPAHLRNRVRHDLLPALLKARPALAAELLALSRDAATVRAELDRVARMLVVPSAQGGAFCVASESLSDYDSMTLAMLWPSMAAVAGITLDRRGTLRLARFTNAGANGARIQLSGGFEVFKHRGNLLLRSHRRRGERESAPLHGDTRFGSWRFDLATERLGVDGDSEEWSADLPADSPLTVRHWKEGDRMRRNGRAGAGMRRVARFFADAHIDAAERRDWPVVVAGDEIVWIPGVCRVDAVPARSGRPAVRYTCERSHR